MPCTRFAAVVLALFVCANGFAAGAADVWLDVPFVKQQKDGCGAASIAMVMQYWLEHENQPVRASARSGQIETALGSPAANGISATDMMRYFEQNGFRAFAFTGQWNDLEEQLTKGRPLIAALQPEGGGLLHYVVVAGVDDRQQTVLVNDPAQRKLLKQDRTRFEREWRATGDWMLLAVPAPGWH
jgi:ABC-type bacteriocin/lantibiotic exporter with double-glycine peptidase domain